MADEKREFPEEVKQKLTEKEEIKTLFYDPGKDEYYEQHEIPRGVGVEVISREKILDKG